ncbi:MAG: hypothetical protein KDA93_01390 [Planctomycetaceae bacterium]|nr:hypothetical protein [Planctomycetaceae bacterium]
MTSTDHLQRYDRAQTYPWNYEHAPEYPPIVDVPDVPGEWSFCGLKVLSPLGIPAGPLLNGRWVLYYGALGFDVLTYKTVRSSSRECYPLPNLVPVNIDQIHGSEHSVAATDNMRGSWAVSFGMPSAEPDVWRRDIEWTRKRLPSEQVLSVSVVGTVQPGWSIEQLADDYALCARWAVESGADCIETNFSCPNVSTCDGQLYQQPESAAVVTERVRAAIGDTPYIIKIGHVTTEAQARDLLESVAPHIDAVAMTNSVAARVTTTDGTELFDGQPRGICGQSTLEASLAQVVLFRCVIDQLNKSISIIGVGGASTADDVRRYLNNGVVAIHMATAPMLDPLTGVKIRHEFAGGLLKGLR